MRRARVLLTTGSWVEKIAAMLAQLGARTRILAPGDDWRAAYRRATHVLIPGGADIAPGLYGQSCTWARPGAPERDAQELPLARQALADGKPLMGICRGHQVITVAAGGTLYQDIAQEAGVLHPTAQPHRVRALPGTYLAALYGTQFMVNSYHHQSVARVPAGWRVVAETLDGAVVEAIETPLLPVVAVQWHPEVQNSWELFEQFLQFRD